MLDNVATLFGAKISKSLLSFTIKDDENSRWAQ